MYFGNIKKNDIANGPGIRVSLFVSGCRIHCKNCFNKVTWDFNYGKEFTKEVEESILEELKSPFITGLTILGGEPFEKENQQGLYPFIRRVRNEYPNKSIWMFSGYIFDKDIYPKDGKSHTDVTLSILSLIDVLVDGPFMEEKKNICLNFRGSTNQRIIDVKETLKKKSIVLHELNN